LFWDAQAEISAKQQKKKKDRKMSIAVFDNLNILVLKHAIFLKTNKQPKLTFNFLCDLKVSDLLALCACNIAFKDLIYKTLCASVQNKKILDITASEVSVLKNIPQKSLFTEYTYQEIWLLIYTFIKDDFRLAYDLYSNKALLYQFKENFLSRDLRDDFHNHFRCVFLLFEKFTYDKISYEEAAAIYAAANIKHCGFSLLLIRAVKTRPENDYLNGLKVDLDDLKPGLIKIGFAYTIRLLFGTGYFKDTIALHIACKALYRIISCPSQVMPGGDQKKSISIAISPTLNERKMNKTMLLFPAHSSPTDELFAASFSDEASPPEDISESLIEHKY
jgi:hypothetical protein